jgi:hypothetical protein
MKTVTKVEETKELDDTAVVVVIQTANGWRLLNYRPRKDIYHHHSNSHRLC